jgi:hypothetical protein
VALNQKSIAAETFCSRPIRADARDSTIGALGQLTPLFPDRDEKLIAEQIATVVAVSKLHPDLCNASLSPADVHCFDEPTPHHTQVSCAKAVAGNASSLN